MRESCYPGVSGSQSPRKWASSKRTPFTIECLQPSNPDRDYTRIWVTGYGVPNSVGVCGQGSDFTAWDPLPESTPALTSTQTMLWAARPLSACKATFVHSNTNTPLSTAPREGLGAARAPSWKHTWLQTQPPFLPVFDPGYAIVPVRDGLCLVCTIQIILASTSSRCPQAYMG